MQDRQAEHVYVLLDALRVRHAPPHVPRVVRPYREVEPLHQSGAGIAEVGLSEHRRLEPALSIQPSELTVFSRPEERDATQKRTRMLTTRKHQ